jgi:beta-galactosidase
MNFPNGPAVEWGHVLHGGDYNPEQWPESVWDDDVRLMQEAHVNVVTLPVFGWVSLQPREDIFTFEWLDLVMDKLHAGGIGVCMATATGSTPAWLDQKYPDILQVDVHGQKRKHAGRHVFCPSSKNFRWAATGLVEAIADRYKDHPALRIWHVSNEYGNYCYCDQCAAAFRVWLQAKYSTIDELNARWYTAFWGHTLTDWTQIDTPTTNGERHMQAMAVDYDRFQSESILASYQAEVEVLRAATPDIPITTNLMGAFKPLDYHKWAKSMDVVSWDCYPQKNETPANIAFAHTLMRGLKDGMPFLLMEQTPSQQNWQAQNALKRPGVMRLWSYQAMAHGADSVMYFQWRRGRGGIEKFHGAVVEHVGTSTPRVFQEVAKLGRELESLGSRTLGGRVPSKVAILFDWENWWAIDYSSGPTRDLNYPNQCRKFFAALHDRTISADIVSPESDLSSYSVVIAPVLYMVKPGVAERLEAFVQEGGTFVTTFFSGIVDENDLVYLGGYPGPLRKMLGIWAEEIDALMPGQTNSVAFAEPFGDICGLYDCRVLCDVIHTEGADVLATYATDFYAGEPAVTRNAFGEGKAYYLATDLDASALGPFLAQVCADAGVKPVLPDAPAGVEAQLRISPEGEALMYVLNHNAEDATVPLPDAAELTDLLTGATVQGAVELEKYGVRILVRK